MSNSQSSSSDNDNDDVTIEQENSQSSSDSDYDYLDITQRNERKMIDISDLLRDRKQKFPKWSDPNGISERIKVMIKKCDEKKLTTQFAKSITKSAHLSNECRRLGNQHFASGAPNFGEAFPLYNKCVALAPKGSLELALAYANKSALLIRIEQHKECLRVIDRCLSLNKVPLSTKLKVLIRKAACQNILKHPGLQETRNQVLELIEQLPLSEQKDQKKSLEEACKRKGMILEKDKWFDKTVQGLGLPTSRNTEIPSASSSIKLQYDKKKGRHFVAAKDIKPGEILIVEEPYCSRMKLGVFDSCYGCLNPTYDAVPCDHCVEAVYCSEKCRDTDWDKFHSVECKIIQDLEALGKMMEHEKVGGIALRMTIAAVKEYESVDKLKQEIKDIDSNPDKRTKGFSADGKFLSDKYRSVYGLHDGKTSEGPAYDYPMLAVIAMYMLATRTNFFAQEVKNWKDIMKNEDILFLAELMTKNLDIAKKNAFGVRPYCKNRQLMTSMNFINHCCYPNVHVTHRPGSNIIMAFQTIEKGEELFLNHRTDKDLDFMAIGSNIFGCPCHACQNRWMAVADFPHYSKLLSDQKAKKILSKECESLQPLLEGMMKQHISQFSPEHSVYSLKRFFDCISVFDKYLKVPSYEVYELRECIKKVFNVIGG